MPCAVLTVQQLCWSQGSQSVDFCQAPYSGSHDVDAYAPKVRCFLVHSRRKWCSQPSSPIMICSAACPPTPLCPYPCAAAPQAREVADTAVGLLKAHNRRTLDVITARIYFFYSWAYECLNRLADVRR